MPHQFPNIIIADKSAFISRGGTFARVPTSGVSFDENGNMELNTAYYNFCKLDRFQFRKGEQVGKVVAGELFAGDLDLCDNNVVTWYKLSTTDH